LGKQDENRLRNATNTERDRSLDQNNQGISSMQNRVSDLTGRSDRERGEAQGLYRNAATGGLMSGYTSNQPGSSSGGSSGGGGGGGGPAQPDYLDAFRELQGKTGGFDDKRLGDINATSARLRDTGDLDAFAKRGGFDNTISDISATGGYSDADKANLRARSNAGIADTYQNMQDQVMRQRASSGNFSPGFGAAGMKLARQSAQDIGTQTQNTEAGIVDRVNQNRLQAAGMGSQNALGAYRQRADQLSAGGGLDLNTQQLINSSRLAATSGLSQDTLGRMQIGASSAAANAAIAAANERFYYGQEQQAREFGASGLESMYKAAPTELMDDQNLLFNYRNAGANQQLGLLNGPMTSLSKSPGWMDYAQQGIDMGTSLASPIFGGLTKFKNLSGAGNGLPGYTSHPQ
jgi:hypothetical protein